jgi:hypothetical protein
MRYARLLEIRDMLETRSYVDRNLGLTLGPWENS